MRSHPRRSAERDCPALETPAAKQTPRQTSPKLSAGTTGRLLHASSWSRRSSWLGLLFCLDAANLFHAFPQPCLESLVGRMIVSSSRERFGKTRHVRDFVFHVVRV